MTTIEQQRADTRRFLLGRRRGECSEEELDALAAAVSPRVAIPARRTVTRRGEPLTESLLVVSGMMCRHMDGRDGYRQVLSLQIPGDFIDLHGYPLGRLDHDIGTLTDVEVVRISHARLADLCETYPRLGRLMWFSTLLDAALHREWIFRIGRLEAIGRIAHLLCETNARLEAVGLAANGRFEFPLTQADIGEACGLTSVHVNRTMRRLRETGLAELGNREARILDPVRLAAIAEFVPDYLYLDQDGPVPSITGGGSPRRLDGSRSSATR